MKNILIISIGLILSGSVFATNGSNMIGFGAVSRGMGGLGIAIPMGPESVLKNPSLIQSESNFEFLFAGTYFSPSVESASQPSAADTFLLPSIGFTNKLNDCFTFGLGAYGTGGLGVDYRDTEPTDGVYRMSTAFSIMKFTPALSYNKNNFGIGIGAAIVYGTLGISYDRTPGTTSIGSEGAGTSDDIGYGFSVGTSYDWNKIKVGVNYQSEVQMQFQHQLADAGVDFGLSDLSDDLYQPAEYGIGLAYTLSNLTFGVDVKQILWSSAKGFQDFGWEDQTVINFGASYKLNAYTIRLGYNTATSPLGADAVENTGADIPINILNGLGFPAIIENHFTLGLGYDYSKSFGMDLAAVYSPEEELVFSNGMTDVTVTHSQIAATLAGHWRY